MDHRRRLLDHLTAWLDGRPILYAGTRAIDASPLDWYDRLDVISLTAPRSIDPAESCLEEITGHRVDLNAYSWDDDTSEGSRRLQRALYRMSGDGGVLVPYRPLRVLDDLCLASHGRIRSAGSFHLAQRAFEFKPWVEQQLRAAGLPTLEWIYWSPDRGSPELPHPSRFPIVLRRSSSSGGSGCRLVSSIDALRQLLSMEVGESLWAWTPYLRPSLPVNVNATIFRSGKVVFHPSSVQLVGIEAATDRALIYCGGDFAALKELDRESIDKVDGLVRKIAGWLAQRGYLGAFGVDFLVTETGIRFVEINPRFQASSRTAADLDKAMGRPDQLMTHLAAFADIDPTDSLPLAEVVARQGSRSMIALYNTASEPTVFHPPEMEPQQGRLLALPSSTVRVCPAGLLCLLEIDRQVSRDGWTLDPHVTSELNRVRRRTEPLGPESPSAPHK